MVSSIVQAGAKAVGISGKDGNLISAKRLTAIDKNSDSNVEKALEKVITKHQCKIVDYTVAPRFMRSGKKGNHDWIIEFSKEPKSINDFMSDLDLSIQQNNTDYKAKRFKNITLDKPILHMARENLFYDWLKSKNKVGGQNKIPRLSNDRSFFEELIKMN